MLKEQGQA
jgi:hypothetical protein